MKKDCVHGNFYGSSIICTEIFSTKERIGYRQIMKCISLVLTINIFVFQSYG